MQLMHLNLALKITMSKSQMPRAEDDVEADDV
jgi:hypothetical protein